MNSDPRTTLRAAEDGGGHGELNQLICQGLAEVPLPAARSADLRTALLRRVEASVRRHAGLLTVRSGDSPWRGVKTGVRARILWQGPQGASVLIEFAPGASLPVHRHRHLEEGIVLRGGLQLGALELGPGDYHVSPAGSRHGRISSPSGALAFLRGTSLGGGHHRAVVGELLGGLLPHQGPRVHTVLATQGKWESIAVGAQEKLLWQDGDATSRFIRLEPGSRVVGHTHDGDEECMMLNGDAYFGDVLVQAGEFHLAPAGSVHDEVSSDHGALLFVRGRATRPLPPG